MAGVSTRGTLIKTYAGASLICALGGSVLIGRTGAYLERHPQEVHQRIVMAGVRLAGLLNRALGDQSLETSPSAELLGA